MCSNLETHVAERVTILLSYFVMRLCIALNVVFT